MFFLFLKYLKLIDCLSILNIPLARSIRGFTRLIQRLLQFLHSVGGFGAVDFDIKDGERVFSKIFELIQN